MNELIRELAEQAGYDILPFYTVEDNYQIPHYKDEKLEKLAKLVARRCIQVALDADDPFLAVEMGDLFGIEK